MIQNHLSRRKLMERKTAVDLMVIHSKRFPSICPVLIHSLNNDVWVSVWRYVYMNAGTWEGQKVVSDSLELEFQLVMSCWRWVLRPKLLPFASIATLIYKY